MIHLFFALSQGKKETAFKAYNSATRYQRLSVYQLFPPGISRQQEVGRKGLSQPFGTVKCQIRILAPGGRRKTLHLRDADAKQEPADYFQQMGELH